MVVPTTESWTSILPPNNTRKLYHIIFKLEKNLLFLIEIHFLLKNKIAYIPEVLFDIYLDDRNLCLCFLSINFNDWSFTLIS